MSAIRRLLTTALCLWIAATPAGSTAAVNIEFGNNSKWEELIVARFNELYEGRIQVSVRQNASGEDLLVAVAGGNPPSVAVVDRFEVGSLAAAGVVIPLDAWIERDNIKPEDFFKPAWDEAVYQGQVYAIPRNTDTRALYFNKQLFRESGLDSEQPPRTWEEMVAFGRRIDRWEGDRLVQVGWAPHWGNWYFPGWLWSAGGSILDPSNQEVTWDGPEGIRAIEWMDEQLQYYGRSTLKAFSSEYGNSFYNGRVGMEINTPGRAETLINNYPDIDWSLAYPPRPEGLEDTPVSWSGGHALAIPYGAPHPEAGWEFIKFYASLEAQLIVSRVPRMPVLRSAATSPDFLEVHPHMLTFVELMPYSKFRPVVPVASELYALYRQETADLLEEGRLPAAEIVRATAQRARQILSESLARSSGAGRIQEVRSQ